MNGNGQLLEPTLASRVNIVGFAHGHRHKAPWTNLNDEFWGLNRLHTVLADKPWTRWFEVHDLDEFYRNDEQHKAFLRRFAGPVYVRPSDLELAHEWGITTAQPYDVKGMVAKYGSYFTNSISYMLAYAVELGFSDVGLYGVDMAQDHLLQNEYCIGGDSRVLTADLRWVPADTVRIGDELVGFDEEPESTFRFWRKATVTNVQDVTRPSYRLLLADGTKFVSSQEHRWLSMDNSSQKWSETRHMQSAPGNPDRQSNMVKVFDTWDSDRSWSGGYLAAAFDGEGYLRQAPRDDPSGVNGYAVALGFAQRNNAMADVVRSELTARGFRWSESEAGSTMNYTIRGGRAEIVRFLGSVRPQRLLSQFNPGHLGQFTRLETVKLVEKEYVGEVPLIGITTDTATFVAEGYASHNSHQRPLCEYFLGILAGRGAGIHLPPGCDLLASTHLYGIEAGSYVRVKMQARLEELGQRKEEMKQQLGMLEAQKGGLVNGINQLDGAMQECEYWLRNHMTPEVVQMGQPEMQEHLQEVTA